MAGLSLDEETQLLPVAVSDWDESLAEVGNDMANEPPIAQGVLIKLIHTNNSGYGFSPSSAN